MSAVDDLSAQWRGDLTRDPRYHDARDDSDWNYGNYPNIPNRHIRIPHPRDATATISTSRLNIMALDMHLSMLGSECKSILEIGVDHGNDAAFSSTEFFINRRPHNSVYLSVDINPKQHIQDASNNVHTWQGDSADVAAVMAHAATLQVSAWDFIFIDGWHSINQVLKEWEYTRWLSPHSIVALHDTAVHPGPHLLMKCLDRSRWQVIENACAFEYNDYGIGFARRRLKDFTS